MNVSNLAAGSALQSLFAAPSPAAAAAPASAAAQAASLRASSETVLFSSISGAASAPPDLSGLAAAAQAYSLYTNPALLQQLAAGTAAPAPAAGAAVAAPPTYSFNPFDEASWWTNPGPALGATVDTTA